MGARFSGKRCDSASVYRLRLGASTSRRRWWLRQRRWRGGRQGCGDTGHEREEAAAEGDDARSTRVVCVCHDEVEVRQG